MAADFDCGEEPTLPPQETVKSAVENLQIDTTTWGRTCRLMLQGRAADAARYGLLPETKKK